MAQASVQYTPVQVLQAARRAEAEGKMDYALQFYRHIVEHHGTSVEAQEAREGLFRIAEWRWGEARVARRQEAGAGNSGGNAAASSPPNASSAGGSGAYSGQRPTVAAVNPQPAYAPEAPDQAVPMTTGATRMPQIIAREAAKAEAAKEPAAFKARFGAAKICASLVSICGWVGLVAGIAIGFVALIGAAPQFAAPAMLGLPLGLLLSVPVGVGGLVLIVAGYLAIAVFESTNATLEMLNMRRGRPGY